MAGGLIGEVRLSSAELDKSRKSADGVRDGASGRRPRPDDMYRGAKTAAREVEQMDGLAAAAARSFMVGSPASSPSPPRCALCARPSSRPPRPSNRNARLEAVLRATGHAAGLTRARSTG